MDFSTMDFSIRLFDNELLFLKMIKEANNIFNSHVLSKLTTDIICQLDNMILYIGNAMDCWLAGQNRQKVVEGFYPG